MFLQRSSMTRTEDDSEVFLIKFSLALLYFPIQNFAKDFTDNAIILEWSVVVIRYSSPNHPHICIYLFTGANYKTLGVHKTSKDLFSIYKRARTIKGH